MAQAVLPVGHPAAQRVQPPASAAVFSLSTVLPEIRAAAQRVQAEARVGVPVPLRTVPCLPRLVVPIRNQQVYPAASRMAHLILFQAGIPPALRKAGEHRRALHKAQVGAKAYRKALVRRLEHRIRWEALLAPVSDRFNPAAYPMVQEKAGERALLSAQEKTGRAVREQTGPTGQTIASQSVVRLLPAPRSPKALVPVSPSPSGLHKAPATDRRRPIPLPAALRIRQGIAGEPLPGHPKAAARRKASVILLDSHSERVA